MDLNLFKKCLFVFFIASFSNHLSAFGEFVCKNLTSQKQKDKNFLSAVISENLDNIKYYLNCGANINAIINTNDWSKRDPLPFYRYGKHTILDSGIAHFDKYSALMLSKNHDIVDYLIKNGADINYGFMCFIHKEDNDEYRLYAANQSDLADQVKMNVIDHAILDLFLALEGVKYHNLILKVDSLLKAGARPNKKTISILREKVNDTTIATSILRFLKNDDKDKRIQYTRKTLHNMPKDLINLTGEYISGEIPEDENEGEEKRGQE